MLPELDATLNAVPLEKLPEGRRGAMDTVCLVVTPPM